MNSWDAIRIVNNSDWPKGVKNLVRTLLQWRNSKTGVAYPSVQQIGEALGVAASTVRSYVNQAIECGAVVVEGERVGGRESNRYRVVLPEVNAQESDDASGSAGTASDVTLDGASLPLRRDEVPDRRTPTPTPPESGAQPAEIRCPPHRNPVATPPESGAVPSRTPPRNLQQPPVVVVDVFDRLGISSLREHPNATPERMAWIEREAPSKKNPSGWAAQCIREGWKPPPPSRAQAEDARAAVRAAQQARFDALPKSEQALVMGRVRRVYDNLSHLPDDHRAVRAAIARVMEQYPCSSSVRVAEPHGHESETSLAGACTNRSSPVSSGNGERHGNSSIGVGAVRADPLRRQ